MRYCECVLCACDVCVVQLCVRGMYACVVVRGVCLCVCASVCVCVHMCKTCLNTR